MAVLGVITLAGTALANIAPEGIRQDRTALGVVGTDLITADDTGFCFDS